MQQAAAAAAAVAFQQQNQQSQNVVVPSSSPSPHLEPNAQALDLSKNPDQDLNQIGNSNPQLQQNAGSGQQKPQNVGGPQVSPLAEFYGMAGIPRILKDDTSSHLSNGSFFLKILILFMCSIRIIVHYFDYLSD